MNKILSIHDSDGLRRNAVGGGADDANLKLGERPVSPAPAGRAIAVFVAIFGLSSLAGCVTKATADAEARKAFVAGEKAAYQNIQSATTSITVLGEVQKHQIPWIDGLTLAQALGTAHYTGAHDPTTIILKRNSVQTQIDPKKLLNGQDIPLRPGDVISIIGQ